MARLRGVAWGLLLAALVLYMGRIWFGDLRREVAALAGEVLGLVRGTGADLAAPLHPASEAAVTLVAIAAWGLLAVAVVRRGPAGSLSLDGRLSLASLLLAAAGLIILVALLLATVLPGLAGPPLLPVSALVALTGAAAILRLAGRSARGATQGLADGAAEGPSERRPVVAEPGVPGLSPATLAGRALRAGVGLVSAAAVALLVYVLARDAIHLAFYRPEASGDEANFWWRATDVLHQVGWDRYLSTVDTAGYVPGYPLVGNVLVGWLPDGLFVAAGRALPFAYGFLALALLVRGAAVGRRRLGTAGLLGPASGLLLIVGYVLLFQGDWIHSMFFELWYGEAFATVLTVLLFVVLDHARRDASPGLRPALALALVALGLGAVAELSKPPLSFLLLPAVVPAMLVLGLLLRPRGRSPRPFLVAVVALAAGALAANLLWGAQLRAHGIGAYYALDLGSLLAFHPDGSFWPLVRYFVGEYQPTWVGFLLVAGLALVRDPRRFLPFLLVGTGMAASIFLLYLGAWSDVEHESGARYILHGVYGFTIFALAALTPDIRQTLDAWLGWLAGRLSGRPPVAVARPGPAGAP